MTTKLLDKDEPQCSLKWLLKNGLHLCYAGHWKQLCSLPPEQPSCQELQRWSQSHDWYAESPSAARLCHQAPAWGVLGQPAFRNPYIKHFLGQYNAIDV